MILGLATGLRLYGLGEPDYWLDELHSLANSAARRADFEAPTQAVIFELDSGTTELTPKSTWPEVWRGMRVDSHPPTYFLLLLSWRRIFGDGALAVRTLPAIFSILSLVPIAMILREFRRPMLGLGAAAMLALAFAHIRFGQDNRPYSLAMLLVGISFWTFAKMLASWDELDRRRRWLWSMAYVVATFLSVMTHYFSVAALVGQVVLILSHGRGAFRRVWIILVTIAALAFGVIWGPSLLVQWDFIANQDWLREPEANHTLRSLYSFFDAPIRLAFRHEEFTSDYPWALAGALVLGFALTALRGPTDTAAKMFALWYVIPLLFFASLDLASDRRLLRQLRFVYMAMPGLVGLTVIAASRLRGVKVGAVVCALCLAMCLTLRLPTPVNPDADRAAKYIAEQWRPGDLLVFNAIGWPRHWALYAYQVAAYCVPRHTTARPPVVLIEEPPDEELKAAIAAFDRLIVVSPRVDVSVNPVPGVFRHVDKTGRVLKMGEIHLFERIP